MICKICKTKCKKNDPAACKQVCNPTIMAVITCAVCTEKVNKTNRKAVVCNYCDFVACRECVPKYMFQSIQEPHCMSCKVPWDHDFIASAFPKTFVGKDLRAYREKVLFERQKAMLPETQAEITRERGLVEARALLDMARVYEDLGIAAKARKYRDEAYNVLGYHYDHEEGASGAKAVKANKPDKPVRRCLDEGCRGFLMKRDWSCGICHIKACKHCMADITEDDGDGEGEGKSHVCKEEDVATTKLLMSNTKPCPGCGIMISKVDGCSTMWCVECHTTFDWNTLEKDISGHAHNPHQLAWMRRNGQDIPRAPGDIPHIPQGPCGAEGGGGDVVMTFMQVRLRALRIDQDLFINAMGIVNHIRAMGSIDAIMRRQEARHAVLRRQYLANNLSEEDFKRKLYVDERKIQRERAVRDVFALFRTQTNETIHHLIGLRATSNNRQTVQTAKAAQAAQDTILALAEYCNETLQTIARLYNTVPFRFDLEMGIVRHHK